MHPWLSRYLDWLEATNHSPATRRNGRSAVGRFLTWCDSAGCDHDPGSDLLDITPARLEAYQTALSRAMRADGRPLSWGTRAEYLGALRSFLRWCVARRLLRRDHTAALVMPRRPVQLPRAILSPQEVERVLHQADTATPLGLRDRALLELMYSTGLRRAEAAHLRLGDVDERRRSVMIRAGKGQRDRVVPLGRRALRWLSRYLRRARPRLVGPSDPGWLFVSSRGTRLRLNQLSERVSRYVARAELGKQGSCHLFRHTMATMLLEGGADVRIVQEILGHVNLSTTARYTHLAIHHLQEVHARAHPAERGEGALARRRRRRYL